MYNCSNYNEKGISLKLNFRRGSAFASKKAHEYLADKKPEDIQNITVIRHAAIGDFVVMRPFLLELRKFFPKATITLSVTRCYMYGMPEDLVDAIHIVDKQDPKNPKKKTSFLQRLKQIQELPPQDMMFDLTDSALSLMLLFFSKTELKIGYPYRWIRSLFYDIAVPRSDFVLETQSMMHQINIMGANTQHYPLNYALTTQKRDEKEPYIIYFGGASVPQRCWEKERFVKLIEKMLLRYPKYKHVVLKGIKEEEHFNEIYLPFAHNPQVIHQDALPIEDIYDYLAQSSLVVVGDTGIRNMAIAANAPTLGIMWVLNISPMRYLPKTQQHQVVFNSEFTQPSVDEVYEGATHMLEVLYGN